MKERITYEDVLGTHTIVGDVLEDQGLYVSITDGLNDLYIRKTQIKERLTKNINQTKLNS